MRLTTKVGVVIRHVGDKDRPDTEISGTVESVLRDIMKEIVTSTLYTRIEVTVARNLDEAKSGSRKSRSGAREDTDFFDSLMTPELQAIIDASGEQE